MIITHPLLFNAIVVLFIAFTSGWVVFVVNHKKAMDLANRIRELEKEKEKAGRQIHLLEEQLEKGFTYPLNSTPVIKLSSPVKASKTNW